MSLHFYLDIQYFSLITFNNPLLSNNFKTINFAKRFLIHHKQLGLLLPLKGHLCINENR